MNRKLVLHSSSALAGIVGLLALVVVAAASSPEPQVTTSQKATWPPRPEDIVNVHWANLTLPQVPPGTPAVIFTVPSDRWLIVTQGSVRGGCDFDLCEDLGGILTVKRRFPYAGGTYPEIDPSDAGPLGWVFRPGSSVVLRNTGGGGSGCGQPSGANVGPTLIGYLAR